VGRRKKGADSDRRESLGKNMAADLPLLFWPGKREGKKGKYARVLVRELTCLGHIPCALRDSKGGTKIGGKLSKQLERVILKVLRVKIRGWWTTIVTQKLKNMGKRDRGS